MKALHTKIFSKVSVNTVSFEKRTLWRIFSLEHCREKDNDVRSIEQWQNLYIRNNRPRGYKQWNDEGIFGRSSKSVNKTVPYIYSDNNDLR